MSTDLRVALVLRAIDQATAPIRRVGQSLRLLSGPAAGAGRAVGAAFRAVDFKAIGGAVGDTGKSFSRMSGEVGKLALKLGALGGAGAWLFKSQLIDTASEFEGFKAQLVSLEGSSEGAERAMSWVTDFAKRTPGDLGGVMEAFTRMRAYGLDPMDGSMQALVDQTSKLGFTQEKLQTVVRGVGQAWTKGKLQGQEIMQLMEAGIPVWDLLASASGRSTAELQKMSAAGGLTRKAITGLITEMGKQSKGAALEQMKTWRGMTSNFGDAWMQFKLEVMRGGVFDWLRTRLAALLEKIDEMTKSGELQQWAKRVGDAITGAFDYVWSHRNDIVEALRSIRDAFVWVHDAVGGTRNMVIAISALFAGRAVASIAMFAASLAKLSVTILAQVMPALGWKGLGFALFSLKYHTVTSALPALAKLKTALLGASATAGTVAAAMGATAAAAGAILLAVSEFRKHKDALDATEAGKGVWDTFTGGEGFKKFALSGGLFGGVARVAGQMWDPRALLEDVGLLSTGEGASQFAPPVGAQQSRAAMTGGKTDVGGTLDIRIRQDGPPLVTRLESRGPLDLSVDAGLSMVTP